MDLNRRKQIFIRALLILSGVVLFSFMLLMVFVSSVYWGAFGKLQTTKELANFENEYATVVYSADGKELGEIFEVNRIEVGFEELPESVVEALVATEDNRFYDHDGIDHQSLLRVLVKTLLLGDRSSGGGSTISQQLIKNRYGRKDHGVLTIPVNKLKEMILAHRLEAIYSKEEILNLYINTVSFGENTYGIAAAARRFFNKQVAQLTITESATLIGMLKAPTTYNPRLNPESSLLRRNVVISQMEKYAYLDSIQADTLKWEPITLNYNRKLDEEMAGYFVEQVKQKAREILLQIPEGDSLSLEKDGLIIETTLNYELQAMAVKAMENHLSRMQDHLTWQYSSGKYRQQLDSLVRKKMARIGSENDTAKFRNVFSWTPTAEMTLADSIRHILLQLHAGMVALDPQSGAVLTYVGGIDFATNPFDQVRAHRQMASVFKPILYTAALMSGKSPCDYVDNEPFTLTDYNNWQPSNYNEESGGKYSLAGALANSKNIPSIRLLFETGFDQVREVWESLGFSDPFKENPSVALGTLEANLIELASGYAAFAASGEQTIPYLITKIKKRNGCVIYQNPNTSSSRVIDSDIAHQITAMLQHAVNEGTGRSFRTNYGISVPLAGKTGTSQNYADAWFVGYNPGIIIAARVGASLPFIHFVSGKHGSGSTLALPLVGQTLAAAQDQPDTYDLISQAFPNSASIEEWIDCPDFMESTDFEKIIRVFQKEETTLEKEQKRAKRKSFFKKLFNKSDN